jgi:hypothetical protein
MEVKQNGNTILTRWYPNGSYIKETSGRVFTGHACPPKLSLTTGALAEVVAKAEASALV